MHRAATAWIAAVLLATGIPAAAVGTAPPIACETWLNGPAPGPDELRGKPVLVEFWTFDCGNCVRTVPALLELHRKYRDWGLVVLGIHTPELEHERNEDRVRDAIERLGVTFPVALDDDLALWNAFGSRYLPSIFLVDPDGRIVFRHVGELHEGTQPYRALVGRIERLIANSD